MKKKSQGIKTIPTDQNENLNLRVQLARALADYDNLRKRTEEEKGIWIKIATQNLVQKVLPIIDTLETAQTHLKDPGLAIAITQASDLLKEEGLEEINPKKDESFDPELHEAIDSEELSGKAGKIVETLTKGWKFTDGMVVRYAKVKVYK